MAQLWVRDDSGEWGVLALDDSVPCYSLTTNPPRITSEVGKADSRGRAVVLLPEPGAAKASQSEREDWVLLAAPGSGVSVNGLPLIAGIRVPADRDEINVFDAGIFYFSTEMPARPETFHEGDRSSGGPPCPRCKRTIKEGETYVRCPKCGILYHHLPEHGYPCWTYSDRCAVCGMDTGLNEDLSWSPYEL